MKKAHAIFMLVIFVTALFSRSVAKEEKVFEPEVRGTDVGPTHLDGFGGDTTERSGSGDVFESHNENGVEKQAAHLHGNDKRQGRPTGCETEGCQDTGEERSASSIELLASDRVRSHSEHAILDAAFSSVDGSTNTCLAPGLDAICSVLHKGVFCWVSLDGEQCTLSESTEILGDDLVHDEDVERKDVLQDDEQGKPEVQQITQKVLEVLPEAAKVNFALSRDGAKVLASNQGAKRVGAILDDDSDTFMRNDCKDNKWVVIELSQVARVSSLDISQNELYSSRLKEFSVYGMQSHPRTLATLDSSTNVDSNGWTFMGKFESKKSKGTQSFDVDSSRWVRYLLIRFLTHYGTENVCAINEIAVYGTSAAEELEAQLANDELVFDSVKDQVAIEEKNDTIIETVVPEGKDENNASSLLSIDKNSTNQSNKILVILNDTSISNMQRIISQNLFSYAASNHSSSAESMSPMCMQGSSEDSIVTLAKPNITEAKGSMEKGVSAPPPPSAEDLSPIPKPKTGGNLYETLIQELRATKAQQKMVAKSIEGMHKNVETVAEELASLRESSGLLSSFEIQEKIDQLEQKLYQISRNSSHQSSAAITLFAAVMASVILQLEMFSAPSKPSILMDIAKGLVALNVFVGGALMLKGTFTSS